MADRSSSSDPSTGAGTGRRPDEGRAPGLGEQFGRTRSALFGLIAAHIKLAKAELSEIGGEIKRAAALGGAALMLLFLAGMLIVVGLMLYLGEAIFGSIGWGVLDGSELLLGVGVLLVLAIIDLDWGRAISTCVIAIAVGLVVTGFLLVDWSWLAGRILPASVALLPELAVAVVLLGVVGALLGSGAGRQGVISSLIGGAVLGVIVRLALGTFAPLSVA